MSQVPSSQKDLFYQCQVVPSISQGGTRILFYKFEKEILFHYNLYEKLNLFYIFFNKNYSFSGLVNEIKNSHYNNHNHTNDENRFIGSKNLNQELRTSINLNLEEFSNGTEYISILEPIHQPTPILNENYDLINEENKNQEDIIDIILKEDCHITTNNHACASNVSHVYNNDHLTCKNDENDSLVSNFDSKFKIDLRILVQKEIKSFFNSLNVLEETESSGKNDILDILCPK